MSDSKHVEAVALKKLDYFAQWFNLSGQTRFTDWHEALNCWLAGNEHNQIDAHGLCSDEIAVIRAWQGVRS